MTQHATQQGFALVRIDENGCITIPAEQRKLLGFAEGVVVVATVRDGELRIRPVSSVIADLQARVSRYDHTDECASEILIAMRREEAEREGL